MDDWLAGQLLLMVALSMLATPLLFLAIDRLLGSDEGEATAREPDRIDRMHPVIIAGGGRFARTVHRLLRGAGYDAVLLDNDMGAVETMRRLGHPVFLGDPTRPEVLESAGLSQARVLVAALDDREATARVVALARKRRPDLRIIARAEDRAHAHALTHAGADEVLREVFDSSLRAGRHVLEAMGFEPEELAEAERLFARLEGEAMRELAELWRPDVAIHENEPYLARSRELGEEMERALGERLRRRDA